MRLSSPNLPEIYRLAQEGNVFAKMQIISLRIRLIQNWRRLHPFDRFCVLHKKRNGL